MILAFSSLTRLLVLLLAVLANFHWVIGLPFWGEPSSGMTTFLEAFDKHAAEVEELHGKIKKAQAEGDINRAWPMARAFDPITHACFVESNPVPVKEMLSLADSLLDPLPTRYDKAEALRVFQEIGARDLVLAVLASMADVEWDRSVEW